MPIADRAERSMAEGGIPRAIRFLQLFTSFYVALTLAWNNLSIVRDREA